jgi:hypothetical protein
VVTAYGQLTVGSFFALGDVERDSIVSQIDELLDRPEDSPVAVRERLLLVRAGAAGPL